MEDAGREKSGKMKKALFMGEICWNLLKSGCLKGQLQAVGKTKFPSPISLGETFLGQVPEGVSGFGLKLDYTKDLKNFFQKEFDCLIIDLSRIITPLIKRDGVFYTCPTKKEAVKFKVPFLQESNQAVSEDIEFNPVIPADYNPEQFFRQFDSFIDKILTYVSGRDIWLIHAHMPAFYVVGEYVRKWKGGYPAAKIFGRV